MNKLEDSELYDILRDVFYEMGLDNRVIKVADNYPDEKSIYVDYTTLNMELPSEHHGYIFKHSFQFFEQAEKALMSYLPDDQSNYDIHFRVENLPKNRRYMIREIKQEQLYKFISIDGTVSKTYESVPEITKSVFKCGSCYSKTTMGQDGQKLEEPIECKYCGKSSNKTNFELIKEECDYVDFQKIVMQDPPEQLKGGEQPQTLNCWMKEDMVDKVEPGTHVVVNGIIDTKKKHKNSKTMDIYMRVKSVEVKDTEYEDMDLEEKDIEKIEELGEEPDILEKVIGSIAPSIHGHRDEKLGLSLQLFGGLRKTMPDGSLTRGDIHVLLVGDPGTAKSQLLRYMSKLTPRGMSSTGKGVTSAGLTASATREEVFGESKWTLQAGTLVLADMGLATVDELDKMNSKDREAMHEAMEQQTVSVDKADIHATLPARCSILGASNPDTGRFIPHKRISEQIGLEPPLLSRFDLIYAITDRVDEERDKELAEHILNMHREGERMLRDEHYEPDENYIPDIEVDLLKKYVSYAKTIKPELTDGAEEKLYNFYGDVRKTGEGEHESVPITARQLESLVRMAEASARLHLREEATERDASIAINTMKHFLDKIVSTDKGYDIDLITDEYSHEERTELEIIRDIIRANVDDYDSGVPKEVIVEKAGNEGIDESEVRKQLDRMRNQGQVYTPENRRFKLA